MTATDRVLRLAQIGRDLLALHLRGAAFSQQGFLTVLWFRLLQFIRSMSQIIRLASGALHSGAMVLQGCVCSTSGLPQGLHRGYVLLQAGECVQQSAVRGSVDQRPLIMLAVDFFLCR